MSEKWKNSDPDAGNWDTAYKAKFLTKDNTLMNHISRINKNPHGS